MQPKESKQLRQDSRQRPTAQFDELRLSRLYSLGIRLAHTNGEFTATKFDELIRLTLILNLGHINHGEKRQYYNENADDIKK